MADLRTIPLTQAEKLQVERRRLDQGQSQRAAYLGVTLDVYLAWEKGRRKPLMPARRLKAKPWEVCRLLRARANLSQAAFAKIIGLSRVTINQMEVGRIDAQRLIRYWEKQYV